MRKKKREKEEEETIRAYQLYSLLLKLKHQEHVAISVPLKLYKY